MSPPPRVHQKALPEVLRDEWQNLAREILAQDPDNSCPHLRALLLHAQRRVEEYACLIEDGLPVT